MLFIMILYMYLYKFDINFWYMIFLFFNIKISIIDDDIYFKDFVIMVSVFNLVYVYKFIRRFNFYVFVLS